MKHFLHTALPGVDTSKIEKLFDRLVELGVLNFDDVQFVEASHIEDILPPIQVKKLLKCFQDSVKSTIRLEDIPSVASVHNNALQNDIACLILGSGKTLESDRMPQDNPMCHKQKDPITRHPSTHNEDSLESFDIRILESDGIPQDNPMCHKQKDPITRHPSTHNEDPLESFDIGVLESDRTPEDNPICHKQKDPIIHHFSTRSQCSIESFDIGVLESDRTPEDNPICHKQKDPTTRYSTRNRGSSESFGISILKSSRIPQDSLICHNQKDPTTRRYSTRNRGSSQSFGVSILKSSRIPQDSLMCHNQKDPIQKIRYYSCNRASFESFEIPWASFSIEVMQACKEKKRINKKLRSQMIRTLVDAIQNVVPYPGRKQFWTVAEKMVDKYPDTFMDDCEGVVVAGGCSSLMKQIEDAWDNKKRRTAYDLDGIDRPAKRKNKNDSYGCVNWQPDLPHLETKGSQKFKKDYLISEFIKEQRDDERVADAMEQTFASQRCCINSGMGTLDIINQWPFLFEEAYLLKHYELLMEHNIHSLFTKEIPQKGQKIYHFMQTKSAQLEVLLCLNRISCAKERLRNSSPEVVGSILLLMAYFKENESILFQIHPTGDGCKDLKDKNLIKTPFIAALSESIFSCEKFIIVIDGMPSVMCSNFISAMSVLFSVFYVFNIKYPEGASATLEFIQRLYADINPYRGSKSSKHMKFSVDKKILNIIEEMKSFKYLIKVEV